MNYSCVHTLCVYSPELPHPIVTITINSSTGTGQDQCLGLDFGEDGATDTDSLRCQVDVVDKLVVKPEVSLKIGSTNLTSQRTTSLTYNLKRDDKGTLVCRACVSVPAAGINFCNQNSVEIKREGTYVETYIILYTCIHIPN